VADPTLSHPSATEPVAHQRLPDPGGTTAPLPSPLSSFVGREAEVARVVALLRDPAVRLLTLTGPGGVGKTRLALRAAEEVAADFANGAAFVPLASVSDAGLVLPAVARALGVRPAGGRPLAQQLGAVLAARRLVLLDNLEQVLDAAPLLAKLLAACPGLSLLATSREPLHLSGEHEFPVPPLRLPDPRDYAEPGALRRVEAVALFEERARAVRPDFALAAEDAPAVAELCTRLDGLPLAIELAAARVKVFAPQALLARLDRRLGLLTGGPRDQPARLRSLRDAVAWSHDLLPPPEQVLFQRLAVFVGSFTLEAAEAVARAAGDPGMDAFAGVEALAEQSLVHRLAAADADEPRFGMLETVREYGLEQLDVSGEEPAARAAHAAHFLALAEQVGKPWRPDPVADFARLGADLDNLRAALVWAFDRGEATTLLRLAVALRAYWLAYGGLDEGRGWLDRALTLVDAVPAALRATVLQTAGWIAHEQGDVRRAEALLGRSRALFRAQNDAAGEFDALLVLAYVAGDRGELARSRALAEEALRLVRSLGEPIRAAFATRHVGWIAHLGGDAATGERLLREAVALFRRAGCGYGAALTLSDLGDIALDRGEHARAAEFWRERLNLTWNA